MILLVISNLFPTKTSRVEISLGMYYTFMRDYKIEDIIFDEDTGLAAIELAFDHIHNQSWNRNYIQVFI